MLTLFLSMIKHFTKIIIFAVILSLAASCEKKKENNTSLYAVLLGAFSSRQAKPKTITFAANPYSFPTRTAITTITPTITGSVSGCNATPELPKGLTIEPVTCAISGSPLVPQTAATYSISASGASTSISLTITRAVGTFAASPYSFPRGTAITTITPTITSSLGGCTATPELPKGLIIDPATCAISGTPLVPQTAGTYTVSASDVSASISLTVTPAVGPLTIRTLGADGPNSMAFGNNIYVGVMVSGANRIITSTDTITWTERVAPQLNPWRSVTFGNGTFVAVADTGANRVMTSTDGINWTLRTAAAAVGWYCVGFGNGVFVAGSYTGTSPNQIMTSPDGITWTARATPFNNVGLENISYQNGQFWGASEVGNPKSVTSTDGITWTNGNIANKTWSGYAFGNGKYLTAALKDVNGNGEVSSSTDAITWTTPATITGVPKNAPSKLSFGQIGRAHV